MKIQKSWFFQIAIAFFFCLILTVPAYASAGSSNYEYVGGVNCSTCGRFNSTDSFSLFDLTMCKRYEFNCYLCHNSVVSSTNPAISHSWTEISCIEPTCTTAGSVTYTCSRCNLINRIDELPALGDGDHTWTETSWIPATCTAAGSVTSTCSTCGEVQTEEFPALDHDWQETGSTSPTCTDAGSIRRTCSRCSLTVSEVVPALGLVHDWQEISRTEATETAAGSIGYACSTCGAVRSERIPPTGLDLSMSGLLEKITAVLAASLGWVSVVADVIARNPILLLVVVIGFIGTAVILFRRILRL